MPYASDRQRRYMHAAAAGKTRKGGISKEAAKKFVSHSEGKPMKRRVMKRRKMK